jgi:type IX secretion system PorP/SprF family membrane protein
VRLLFTYILLLSGLCSQAQHSPLVSHYMLNGLVINPAYTGSREVFTANAMYRNQWVGFDGSPVSQVVSAHTPLKNKSIAVGMLFDNEKIGVSNYTGLMGNVAYRVKLNDATLSFGISAGIRMLSARYSTLTTGQANDQVFAGDLRSNIRPDFGAGVYYSNKKYFVGISVPSFMSRQYHITDENLTIRNQPGDYNFILHGGYLFELNEMFKLKPGALLRVTPAGNKQFDLNANVIYNDRFWVGISYRHREAMVALLEFQVNQQFKVAYVYDYALSIFRHYSGGSHEVGLQYEFGFKVKSADPRFF